MTPGKHPNPSAPGSSLCRQPHLTLRLCPTNPEVQPFPVLMFAASTGDKESQVADDMEE